MCSRLDDSGFIHVAVSQARQLVARILHRKANAQDQVRMFRQVAEAVR